MDNSPLAAPVARPRLFVTDDGRNVFVTFLLIISLFSLWGFCNGLIDVMDKHFQEVLHLSLAQSAWVQFAHYLGYFLMALPAGWLATKLGYKGGIVTGLLMVAVGGFWFVPATHIAQFWAFLLGVCVVAAGLTFLETIANPYATVLGATKFSATRINLAQSCNGVGLLLGPPVGGFFFYSKNAAGQSTGAEHLWVPYAVIAVVTIVLAIVFAFANVPDIKAGDEEHYDRVADDAEAAAGSVRSLWARPHFAFAVLAQFLYMAAQAGIFSFFINYMTTQPPAVSQGWADAIEGSRFVPRGLFESQTSGALRLSDAGAASLSSVGLFLFLVGRFTGAAILRKFSAHGVLGVYGAAAAVLCGVVLAKLGWASVAAVFGTYFFMSIMFPTIFAMGIFGLGSGAKRASSFIVMAIMGGAVLPKVMGEVADHSDLSRAFVVPMVCFAVVAAYGFLWPRLSGYSDMGGVKLTGGH